MTTWQSCLARAGLVLIFAALFATDRAAASPARDPNSSDVLRPANQFLKNLVQEGLARSATLRDLVARLESDGIIVYLNSGLPLGPNTVGRTRFMGAGGKTRYLMTDLDDRLAKPELLALLGHELEHTVEIGDDPSVVDDATLIALYQQIGSAHGTKQNRQQWFETDAAIETGRRVYGELFTKSR